MKGTNGRPVLNVNHDEECRERLELFDRHRAELEAYLRNRHGSRTAADILGRVDVCLCDLLELYSAMYDQGLAMMRELRETAVRQIRAQRQTQDPFDEIEGGLTEADFDRILREVQKHSR